MKLERQTLHLAEVEATQQAGSVTRAQGSRLRMLGWPYARGRALQTRAATLYWLRTTTRYRAPTSHAWPRATRSETVATADRLLGTLARPASPGTRAQSSCLEMRGWLYARTHACISHLESGVRETLSVGEAKQKNCKCWRHRPLVESRKHHTEKVRGAMLHSRPALGKVAAKKDVTCS